jgi:hypothetical protein
MEKIKHLDGNSDKEGDWVRNKKDEKSNEL